MVVIAALQGCLGGYGFHQAKGEVFSVVLGSAAVEVG